MPNKEIMAKKSKIHLAVVYDLKARRAYILYDRLGVE
jgi:hypothetical protein